MRSAHLSFGVQNRRYIGSTVSPGTGDFAHSTPARALGAGNAQETHERIVSVGLGEAVQIDAGIETGAAAREALPQAAIEIGKRRNRLFARFRLLGRTKGVGSGGGEFPSFFRRRRRIGRPQGGDRAREACPQLAFVATQAASGPAGFLAVHRTLRRRCRTPALGSALGLPALSRPE